MSSLHDWHYILAAGTLFIYALNIIIGVVAKVRKVHLGKSHHILYFIVCIGTIASIVFLKSGLELLPTGLCLAVLPRTQPKKWIHPVLSSIGFILWWVYVLRNPVV